MTSNSNQIRNWHELPQAQIPNGGQAAHNLHIYNFDDKYMIWIGMNFKAINLQIHEEDI